MNNQIACISDVKIGYGSPQIPKLIQFLCDYFATSGIIIQPSDKLKPGTNTSFKDLSIHEVSVENPYSQRGREEYNKKAQKIIEKINPKILVVCTTFCLPALFGLKSKPDFVIYYYLETAWGYGEKDIVMNKNLGKLVDLIIFTEENRAVKFGEVCGFQKLPFCIIYNCVNSKSSNSIVESNLRNGKLIYHGTIRGDTLVDYFLTPQMQSIPLDIFGNIDPKEKDAYEKKFAMLQEDVVYKGYVPSTELDKIRKNYAYSVVMWNPYNENNLYASPNKFFESIGAGVPPITAPHPQCKLIVNRYKCGLVMPDWSFDSFYEKVRLALEFYKTEEYEKMVQNCSTAIREELNWETQMNKLEAFLKKL